MVKYYKIMFFCFLIEGTLITISSYTWLGMWLGLEINLMSIIPLLTNPKNQFPTESALKYFITQVIASLALLFFMILSMTKNEQIYPLMSNLILTGLFSSVILKMGAAPFHSWFPEVINGLSWMNCLIMLTWQKMAPFIVLVNNFHQKSLFFLVMLASLIVSGVLGLNQTSMRKILAYSSINHIAWMMASIFQTKNIWIIYFSIYSLISMIIIFTLSKFKIFFIEQINMFKNSNLENLSFAMNFFSLGGLPPFLGFFPKWLVVNSLILSKNYFISILLITFTLIPLFFYLRITFSSLTLSSIENSIKMNLSSKFFIMALTFLTLSGLILCTLILNFY